MSCLDDTKFLNLSHCYNRTKMVNLYLKCGMESGERNSDSVFLRENGIPIPLFISIDYHAPINHGVGTPCPRAPSPKKALFLSSPSIPLPYLL